MYDEENEEMTVIEPMPESWIVRQGEMACANET